MNELRVFEVDDPCGPYGEKPSPLNHGIVRWASGLERDGFMPTMQVSSPRLQEKKQPTWKNGGFLTGVVAFFGRLYVIVFYPKMDFIQWRLLNEKEIEEYRIDRSTWERFQKSDTQPNFPGSVRDHMIARLVEHLIHVSPHWESWYIQRFFKNYSWIKRSAIKKIIVPNLCQKNKSDLYFIVACLALVDPTTQWQKYKDGYKTSVVLHGVPRSIIGFGSLDDSYKFTIKYYTSTLKVDHSDFFHMARSDFMCIKENVDTHNEKIKNARAGK